MSSIASLVSRAIANSALLDALHESRRRQAVREIHNHRHLIDAAKAGEFCQRIAVRPVDRTRGPLDASYIPNSASRQMSVKAKVAIAAVLLAFALIHAFGAIHAADGTRATNESGRSPAETAHMYRAD